MDRTEHVFLGPEVGEQDVRPHRRRADHGEKEHAAAELRVGGVEEGGHGRGARDSRGTRGMDR